MEKFSRINTLIGDEKMNKILNSKVAIIGLGGVGGMAAIVLARSGVSNLVIQDFDIINESNINRQVIANSKTIGLYKTDVLEQMILDINPNCKITKIQERYDSNSNLYSYELDYVIDAIDQFDSKMALIVHCLNSNIPIISSMGTAKKFDTSLLKVTTLEKTTYDPLAKKARKYLRDLNLSQKLTVISSTEQPVDCEKLGSYMPVTSYAGILLADYVLKQIIK